MQQAPRQIQVPLEVEGYIQGMKDTILVQADMIGRRTAEIFGLRAQLAEALKALQAKSSPAPTTETEPDDRP